jgi:hypothetical protein
MYDAVIALVEYGLGAMTSHALQIRCSAVQSQANDSNESNKNPLQTTLEQHVKPWAPPAVFSPGSCYGMAALRRP